MSVRRTFLYSSSPWSTTPLGWCWWDLRDFFFQWCDGRSKLPSVSSVNWTHSSSVTFRLACRLNPVTHSCEFLPSVTSGKRACLPRGHGLVLWVVFTDLFTYFMEIQCVSTPLNCTSSLPFVLNTMRISLNNQKYRIVLSSSWEWVRVLCTLQRHYMRFMQIVIIKKVSKP